MWCNCKKHRVMMSYHRRGFLSQTTSDGTLLSSTLVNLFMLPLHYLSFPGCLLLFYTMGTFHNVFVTVSCTLSLSLGRTLLYQRTMGHCVSSYLEQSTWMVCIDRISIAISFLWLHLFNLVSNGGFQLIFVLDCMGVLCGHHLLLKFTL